MTVKDAVVDAAYAAGWSVVRGMPERIARQQFDLVAMVVWSRNGTSVRRLQSNLARIRPDANALELRLLTRDGIRSYFRYWCEIFRMPHMATEEVIERSDVIGDHHLRSAVAAGKGLVMSLPHSGNWDQAGAWLAGTGVPFTTVAERLQPESLFERFVSFRESLGMEVIPLTGGEAPPFEILADRLAAGGVLCLLSDRDLSGRGIGVEFFGAQARMAAGPAALAIDTGATLLPVTCFYSSRMRWGMHIGAPVPVPDDGDRASKIQRMTQYVASAFESRIGKHPQDWHMLQRVWTADLDPSKAPVA
ncbi:MAG TPA: phosphatidylinositol mannoside acyltransferase [Mycobacteriales bacterium]|nr:phosphatidylinositol mannoside acyltransferase [Mycobacteriales bacterium]